MRGTASRSSGGRLAALHILKPEFDVFLKLRQLLGETLILELQLLVLAGELSHLRFQPIEADEQIRHVLSKGRRGENDRKTGGQEQAAH